MKQQRTKGKKSAALSRPTKVAWISHFPVEWLPDIPEPLKLLPRHHPTTWQRVLMEELKRNRSLELHVIALRKEFPRRFSFEHEGVRFHLIRTPAGWRAPSLFWLDTLLIRRVLKAVKPDLVHAWGTENGAALVASRLGFPNVVTIQGLMSWYTRVEPANRYWKLVAKLEHWSLRRARVASAESRFTVQYVRERHPHLEVRHIEHSPAPLFYAVKREPRMDLPRMVFVGSFNYRKGGDLLVKALHSLRKQSPFEVVVAGHADPAMLRTLPPDLVKEVWPHIKFKRNLSPSEVAQEFARATIMVCPTRADTGPVAVKEAVVAGVPVVGSAVGGIPDYVVPGRNGFICAPEDVASLCECLQKALTHPLLSRGEVDLDVLAEKRIHLSADRMARGFLEAYQFVLNGRATNECCADSVNERLSSGNH